MPLRRRKHERARRIEAGYSKGNLVLNVRRRAPKDIKGLVRSVPIYWRRAFGKGEY